jgi:hypothetical protein
VPKPERLPWGEVELVFDRAALVAEPLYHTPDADGLKITSTSTLTGSVHTTVNALREAWSRKTRFDFYWPAFAHLGEQAVLNKEIYYNGDADDDTLTGGSYADSLIGYDYYQQSKCSQLLRLKWYLLG